MDSRQVTFKNVNEFQFRIDKLTAALLWQDLHFRYVCWQQLQGDKLCVFISVAHWQYFINAVRPHARVDQSVWPGLEEYVLLILPISLNQILPTLRFYIAACFIKTRQLTGSFTQVRADVGAIGDITFLSFSYKQTSFGWTLSFILTSVILMGFSTRRQECYFPHLRKARSLHAM